MNTGKLKALLDWVNSTGIEDSVESLKQLSDGVIVVKIIKSMQLDKLSAISESPWFFVKEFLEASNFGCTLNQIQWELLDTGNDLELAKVLLLLLSLTITCPNKEKMILEMTNLDNESQVHIRHILSEALAEGNLSCAQNLFDVLQQKAPPTDQADVEYSDSPAKNSSLINAPSMNSINGSPTPIHNRSVQMLSRGPCRTPVKQIFKTMEEEEVYFSVPASCPPLRRAANARHSFQDFPSFSMSTEGSPVQEFLSSPAVNYRIKIRDLEQKIVILEKNLHAERIAKEECEKGFIEKQAALELLEKKIRDMSRFSIEKQQLFDEIDELHSIRLERDTLEKENSKLKFRLERYDSYSFESKDLKQDLEVQLKQNEELSKQIKNLKSMLAKATEQEKRAVDLEESMKSMQETNALQEQEISHLLTQLHKLKSQNMEQKEHYESRINDYKSIIEDKDLSGLENEGESMGIFMEHRVAELQETMKEMEDSWIRPDVGARLQADLDTAKETMGQYQARLQSASSEKMSLEEEVYQLQQDVNAKTLEVMDSMKKLASANQKMKLLESTTETLRAQIETLSSDKENLKSRVKALEGDIRDSNGKLMKLQVELNLSKNENESNVVAIESHLRRLSDMSHKIAELECQCRTLEAKLAEKSDEVEDLNKCHKSRVESLEKLMANDQRQISKLEEQVKMLEHDRDSSESEIQQLKKVVLEEKQSYSEAKQDGESLRLEVKKYHSACSDLEQSCKVLKRKLDESREKLKQKEEEITFIKDEDSSKQLKVLGLEDELVKAKKDAKLKSEDLAIVRQKLEDAVNTKEFLSGESARLKEEIQTKTQDFMKLEESLIKSQESCESLSKELENSKCEFKKLQDDFVGKTQEKDNKIDDMEKDLLSKQEGLSVLEAEVKSYNDALDEKSVLLRGVTSKLEESEKMRQSVMKDMANSLAEKDRMIFSLQEEGSTLRRGHTEELTSLHAKMEQKNATNVQLQGELDNLRKSYQDLAGELSVKQDETLFMKSSLDEATSLAKHLELNVAEMREEALRKQDECEAHFERKEEEVVQLRSLLGNAGKENEMLKEKMEISSNEVAMLRNSNSTVLAALEESSQKLKKTQQDLDESNNIKRCLEEKMNGMDEMKKALEDYGTVEGEHLGNITKLQERLEEETERASIFKKKMEEARVNHLEDIAEKDKKIESQMIEIKSLVEKITILEQQMEADATARDETIADLLRVKAEVESSELSHKRIVQRLNADVESLHDILKQSQESCRVLEEASKEKEEAHADSFAVVRAELENSKKCAEKHHQESQALVIKLKETEELLFSSNSDLEQITEKFGKLTSKHETCLEELEHLKKDQQSYQEKCRKVDALKFSNVDAEAKIESLEAMLLEKSNNLTDMSESKASLLEEVKSLKILLQSEKVEKESLVEKLKDDAMSLIGEKEVALRSLEENHHCIIEGLEKKIKEKDVEIEMSSKQLRSTTETLISEKSELARKNEDLEMRVEEASQTIEFVKIEKESLRKNMDEMLQTHAENLLQMKGARDEALKSLENEKDRYSVLEARLEKEVLGVEEELSEAKNLVRVVSDEKQFYEGRCSLLQQQEEQSQQKLTQLESNLRKVQEENSALQENVESLEALKNKSDEKLKAIRTQFVEKYREKQEKVLKLEQDLKDWQTRADEETSKYDNLSAMYNEKRAQLNDTVNSLDQARGENMDLQEAIRSLKMKNEMLTTSSSQLSVKKIEEEKKIRSLSAEVYRLTTQLQFAERQIRELRTGTKSFRHSSMSTQPLMTVEEVLTPVRRRSLEISEDESFTNDNLFRCRSDTCLDSPLTVNKKKRKEQNEILDDSLEDILRTPVNLQTCSNLRSDGIPIAESHEIVSVATSRSHMSIESSFLSESPSRITHSRSHSQSQPQLNSSRMSHESVDMNWNSSVPEDASSNINRPANGRRHSGMPRHPSSLAFQTEEEPEDYEWGSLSRLAELQRRNAATLPHLKSSYPIETQGQTPSKCDESVRIGDADGTLRRMTQTSASLQRSLVNSFDDTRQRRMTIDVHSSLPRHSDSVRKPMSTSSDNQLSKRKYLTKDDTSDNPPHKNRKETKSNFEGPSKESTDDRWQGSIPVTEEKEQVDPKRMSMMFEIPNSPRKPQLRSRASRKVQAEKSRADNVPSTSKKISSLMKTLDKSKTVKKNVDEKPRTPSLMDRVKKPLGRFNAKK